jgi:DNA-binding NtrC family response regulator
MLEGPTQHVQTSVTTLHGLIALAYQPIADTVLLVDDEPKVLSGLRRVLQDEAYEILTAGNAEEAASVLRSASVDLILCDEEMPGMPGTECLTGVAREYPDMVRIVLTGHPTLPSALRAINEGQVYQFLTKPCNETDLAITMRRALEQKDLAAKSRDLLDVARSQSVLIDKARVLRRLRDLPCDERVETVAQGPAGMGQQELLEEIDREVTRGRVLLADVRNPQDE